MTQPASVSDNRLYVLDEASYLFSNPDDGLKESLRKIEGVPNASYLVRDGRVFVFAKLIELVKENAARVGTGTDLQPGAVLSLMPQAWVSAIEAVEHWDVIPEPYALRPAPSPGGWVIHHGAFHATVPGVFASPEAARPALVHLLVGGVVSGHGEFSYKGQPLTSCAPFNPNSLPECPITDITPELLVTEPGFRHLSRTEFQAGLPLVDRELFERTKQLETVWGNQLAYVAEYSNRHVDELWARAQDFPLSLLNDVGIEVPDDGREQLNALRGFYPELSVLKDGALYDWFNTYETDSGYFSETATDREAGFLFYLLGKMTDRQLEEDRPAELGRWVAFAFSRGDPLEAAMQFGRHCQRYDVALGELAARMAEAMRFLSSEQVATELRGRPIHTFMDIYRVARKLAPGTFAVTQNMEDLETYR